MRVWVAALIAMVCFASSGFAPAFAQERRVALVIGVSAYENAPPLANTLYDAVDVSSSLQSAGFEIVESYDADYGDMQRALRDFARRLEGAKVGLVYYAGHGVQVDGRNYLLPRDVKLADDGAVQREGLEVGQVLQALAAQPRVSLVFLDACRDNPLAVSLARRQGAARSLAVSQGLAQIGATAADTLVAYSTQPGAVAADGRGRNSPFTEAFLRHVRAPGLDVQEMMRRVRASVIAQTNGVQVPWDNSSLTRSFAFIPGEPGRAPPPANWTPPPVEPTVRQLDIALWNDVKNRSAEEIETYIARYPQGIFADAARARVAALRRAATADRDRARTMAQDIAREFAQIAGRGSLIADPKEPHEFYANARLYELRGDFLNARRSYLGFFNFGLPYVDPHYRFQTFLKVQEGRAGAREVYSELAGTRRADETLAYAAALLLEPEQRKARLEEIITRKPEFAPAYYELARNYSEAQLGVQTLADKEKERNLLQRFVSLADGGKYLGWFIDQTYAAEQLDDARRRLAALARTAVARQVNLTATSGNNGWMLSFGIAEPAQEIFYQLPGRPRASTGFLSMVNQQTGKPMPRPYIELPANAASMTVEVSYKDATGLLRGPFRLAFNPEASLVASQLDVLRMSPQSWSLLRTYDGRKLLYFTHLISSRCAIAEVRYGIDRMTPDRVFALPPCNVADPHRIPADFTIYVEAPPATRFATIQLRYKDGSMSPVQRFDPQE
jgi:uncharacterized caspase-like protein